jgi:hypothetical protein
MSGAELVHNRPRLAQRWLGNVQNWMDLWPLFGIFVALLATIGWCVFLIWLLFNIY